MKLKDFWDTLKVIVGISIFMMSASAGITIGYKIFEWGACELHSKYENFNMVPVISPEGVRGKIPKSKHKKALDAGYKVTE